MREKYLDVIRARVPEKFKDVNIKAFEAGRKASNI
jgi:Pyruvate/2-oxoacid:ferredoxin oxidoreductase gamma subunit